MIGLKQAKELAAKFVQDHSDYNGAELVSDDYRWAGIFPSYAFYLTQPEQPGAEFEPVGLPQHLIIDKVTGEQLVDRILI